MGSDQNMPEVVAIDDDDDDHHKAMPPASRLISAKLPDIYLTNEAEVKKSKLAEEEEELEEGEIIEAAEVEPLAVDESTSVEEEETVVEEEPYPIGKVVRVSRTENGLKKHYKSFGYDGNQYNLEDPVFLAPGERNQKPNMVIIKDISRTTLGKVMVTGQRFYRPGAAKTKDGGFWQSNNTREVFYSFRKDEFPAESVLHKIVVHFIPLGKQIPPRTEHPGFVVQKIYHTKEKLLLKLKDGGHNKIEEIDLLVQKTESLLGNLPNIQQSDAVAHLEDMHN